MNPTITANNGAGTTAPMLVLRPETTEVYEGRSTVTDLISGGIAITQRAARPQSGRLVLLYADRAAAKAGATLHLEVTTFTLVDGAETLTYTVMGRLEPTLDTQTRRRYLLTLDYQAVEL